MVSSRPLFTLGALGDGEVLTPLGTVDTAFTVAIIANF